MKSQKAIEAAIQALERERAGLQRDQDKLEQWISSVRGMLGRSGGRPSTRAAVTKRRTKKKRRLSAAGRKAISEAMKKRWAARKKSK